VSGGKHGRVITFALSIPFVKLKVHVMDAKTARVRAHVRAQMTTDTAETVQNVAAAVSEIMERMDGAKAGASHAPSSSQSTAPPSAA
jgi:uncharacterized protein (UPF0218 family)